MLSALQKFDGAKKSCKSYEQLTIFFNFIDVICFIKLCLSSLSVGEGTFKALKRDKLSTFPYEFKSRSFQTLDEIPF